MLFPREAELLCSILYAPWHMASISVIVLWMPTVYQRPRQKREKDKVMTLRPTVQLPGDQGGECAVVLRVAHTSTPPHLHIAEWARCAPTSGEPPSSKVNIVSPEGGMRPAGQSESSVRAAGHIVMIRSVVEREGELRWSFCFETASWT